MTHANAVPGYGLELPSSRLILESLARYLDDEEIPSVWARACQRAGMDAARPPADAEDLLLIVEALDGCGQLAALCAKGLRIRLLSFLVLSRARSSVDAHATAHVTAHAAS